jgi:HPt (histidine-containing phosphotransfer) domain-containing protein
MAGEDAAEFIPQLIDTYLQETAKILTDMNQALSQKDAVTLRQAAHKLKSSSASLGAITLSNLCKQIEDLGRAGTISDCVKMLTQVENEYERVKLALQHDC